MTMANRPSMKNPSSTIYALWGYETDEDAKFQNDRNGVVVYAMTYEDLPHGCWEHQGLVERVRYDAATRDSRPNRLARAQSLQARQLGRSTPMG